jgi:hypothetical protein
VRRKVKKWKRESFKYIKIGHRRRRKGAHVPQRTLIMIYQTLASYP